MRALVVGRNLAALAFRLTDPAPRFKVIMAKGATVRPGATIQGGRTAYCPPSALRQFHKPTWRERERDGKAVRSRVLGLHPQDDAALGRIKKSAMRAGGPQTMASTSTMRR